MAIEPEIGWTPAEGSVAEDNRGANDSTDPRIRDLASGQFA
jgi:hypothetical protein